MTRVTIRHVAEHAGVSTSTVSRTLHNHPRISEETKRRVIEAAEALNYRSALYPGSQTLKALGLILPTSAEDLLMHPFFTQVMRGISTFAQARGYFTMYGFSQEEEEKLQFLRQYAFSGVVQGLILLAIHQNDRCIEFLSEHEIPFTVIGRPETPGDVLWVDNDNFHAMYDAVNHLIEDGARRIAFVGGPADMNVTRDRLEGYRMALLNRGLEQSDGLIAHADEFSESAGCRALGRILTVQSPDAVVATDDLLGLGALLALTDRRLDPIPCIGFNSSVQARQSNPGLSSVEIQPDMLGQAAARLLIERIEYGRASENHVIIPTRFVARANTRQSLG